MYMYDRPSWTGEVYETECYFPTWINKENAAHVQALVDAHHALFGGERIGPDGAMHLRHRPLIDKWTLDVYKRQLLCWRGSKPAQYLLPDSQL